MARKAVKKTSKKTARKTVRKGVRKSTRKTVRKVAPKRVAKNVSKVASRAGGKNARKGLTKNSGKPVERRARKAAKGVRKAAPGTVRKAVARPRRGPAPLGMAGDRISGVVDYPAEQRARLTEQNGVVSLLLIDADDQFDVGDLAAAEDRLRNLLNIEEGATITLTGMRGELNGQPIIDISTDEPIEQ